MRKSYRCFRSTPPLIGQKQKFIAPFMNNSWKLSDALALPVILYLSFTIIAPVVVILSYLIYNLVLNIF